MNFLNFMHPFYSVFVKFFPKQQNLFAFYVEKPAILNSLFPDSFSTIKRIRLYLTKNGEIENTKPRPQAEPDSYSAMQP